MCREVFPLAERAAEYERADAYHGDDEGDPHEEVEPAEDVVEAFLPVLCRRRGDHVLRVLHTALDGARLETDRWRRRKASVDFVDGEAVDVNLADGGGRIRGFRGSGLLLLLCHGVDVDGEGAVPTLVV